jgi:hypothetical protein
MVFSSYVLSLTDSRLLLDSKIPEGSTMRWTPPPGQIDLLKKRSANELTPPQRARVLELLRVLLKEAMSTTEARSQSTDNREAGDERQQDHA